MERLLVDSGFFWFALVPEVDISLGSWRGESVVEIVASAMRASENRARGTRVFNPDQRQEVL